jgi:hypothetical protein
MHPKWLPIKNKEERTEKAICVGINNRRKKKKRIIIRDREFKRLLFEKGKRRSEK